MTLYMHSSVSYMIMNLGGNNIPLVLSILSLRWSGCLAVLSLITGFSTDESDRCSDADIYFSAKTAFSKVPCRNSITLCVTWRSVVSIGHSRTVWQLSQQWYLLFDQESLQWLCCAGTNIVMMLLNLYRLSLYSDMRLKSISQFTNSAFREINRWLFFIISFTFASVLAAAVSSF
jgi:hypothetical protein